MYDCICITNRLTIREQKALTLPRSEVKHWVILAFLKNSRTLETQKSGWATQGGRNIAVTILEIMACPGVPGSTPQRQCLHQKVHRLHPDVYLLFFIAPLQGKCWEQLGLNINTSQQNHQGNPYPLWWLYSYLWNS